MDKLVIQRRLNPKQELFCQLYISDEESWGNGAESYAQAYELKRVGNWYKTACVSASRLLRKDNVSHRINELLDLRLSDELVDRELAYVVSQKSDLSSKVAAIKEYNRLKRRVDDSPKIAVIPIYGGLSRHNGDTQDILPQKED